MSRVTFRKILARLRNLRMRARAQSARARRPVGDYAHARNAKLYRLVYDANGANGNVVCVHTKNSTPGAWLP